MKIFKFKYFSVLLILSFVFGSPIRGKSETVTSVTSNRTLSGATELHITSKTVPIANNAIINITSTDAYLFFDSIKPGVVLNNYKNQIQVNGVTIDPTNVSSANARIVVYRHGSAVVPHNLAFQPLATYTGIGYTGESQSYTVDQYYSVLHDSNIPASRRATLTHDNAIRSFKLKKGYMATFANEANGMGYSRCFIADKEDLNIEQLPAELDGKVSFIRVFPWEWVSKKGWCGGLWDTQAAGWKWGWEQSDHTNSTWLYDWDASLNTGSGVTVNTLLNQEYVPEKWGEGGSLGVFFTNKRWSHLLGQNEPDHAEQSNLSVETAISEWPTLLKTGARLGSPATTDYNWLYNFMAQCDTNNYRVDYVVVHCYWSKTPQQWYNDLKEVHTRTGRPLWIKEWNNGANWTNEGGWEKDANGNRIYTEANAIKQLNEIKAILNVLDTASFVERYSIYNWVEDARAMILNSQLTKAGEYYASTTPDFAFNRSKEVIPQWTLLKPRLGYFFSETDRTEKLTWTDANLELAAKFIIQKSASAAGPWTDIAEVNGQTKQYTTEPLPAGQTPGDTSYRIRVIGASGAEAISNIAGYTIQSNLPIAGRKYRIKNVKTELYFTVNETDADNVMEIDNYTLGTDNQIFELFADESAPDNFNIAVNGKYLTQSTSSRWNAILSSNPKASEAEYILNTNENGYTTIQSLYYAGQTRYIAPQQAWGVTAGSKCFLDTSTGSDYEYWTFETADMPTGIGDILNKGKESGVSVFPVISRGSLTIASQDKAIVKVLDIAGQILAHYESNGELTIHLNYVSGIYIIMVEKEGKISSHKVILHSLFL
jgi:hypothetical protein